MKTVEELDELTFWAVNTKEAENLMKENERTMTSGMSESEKKAYLLGVQNAFSITNQLLQQGVNNESIQFYNPEVERTEEFSKEELIEWLSKQNDC